MRQLQFFVELELVLSVEKGQFEFGSLNHSFHPSQLLVKRARELRNSKPTDEVEKFQKWIAANSGIDDGDAQIA